MLLNVSWFEKVTKSRFELKDGASPNLRARHHAGIEALNAGQPKEVTTDRIDMSREVMEKHYDKATKNEQMEQREGYLLDI